SALGPAGAAGRARYARAGQLLAGLPVSTEEPTALAALLDLLSGWTANLATPRLAELGLTAEGFGVLLEGVSANSMAGNPVDLTREDLRAILEASL
ncbi:MAG: hypothetical protein ABWZ82_08185, partial [Candidatus Limnocylindrales bacterium]